MCLAFESLVLVVGETQGYTEERVGISYFDVTRLQYLDGYTYSIPVEC